MAQETGFFCGWGGSWDTPYGRFFLEWYSKALVDHGERLLQTAATIFSFRLPKSSLKGRQGNAVGTVVRRPPCARAVCCIFQAPRQPQFGWVSNSTSADALPSLLQSTRECLGVAFAACCLSISVDVR